MKRKTLLITAAVLAAALVILGPILGAVGFFRMLDLSGPVIGGDWHTWRGYTRNYELTEEFTVTFSYFSEESRGYAVYDASDGARLGTILLDGVEERDPGKGDFTAADVDGDGCIDVGVPLVGGGCQWYSLAPRNRGEDGVYPPIEPGI